MRTPTFVARVPQMKLAALAVMSCFASAGAFANPTGGVPMAGTVTMSTPAPNVLEITNSPNSIIHWQGFSINAGEVTRFLQNSATSAVLNRVVTNSPSDIFGTLYSNGRVFLINPNGIVFGPGAVVDVAGLVASSLQLSNEDFLAGHMKFQAMPTAGTVVNEGEISTVKHPGGQVYLVGSAVTNKGVITSPQGEVVLAAGETVELMNTAAPGLSVSISAPDNEALNMGRIFADSGRVGIFAGVVNQGGVVAANGAFLGPDGVIQLKATEATNFAAGSNTTAASLDIDTGSLTVAGDVISGTQSIRATGGVMVQNAPGGFAQLNAQGGQTIEAAFVEVNAVAGGSAHISNFGGNQVISTSGTNAGGEGVAVRSSGGGFAGFISIMGDQRIEIRNADRLLLDGAFGPAQIVNIDGVQSIELTGAGANALALGTPGGLGQSVIGGGGFQSLLAGGPGEQGSITLHGTSGSGFGNTLIVSNQVPGGTQSVSTTGTINVLGGAASASPGAAGIFANGIGGQQTIVAEGIVLQGGSSGSGNSAMIGANSGSQVIEAGAGGITLIGGASGANNFAMINQLSTSPAATQTVQSAGPVLLEGGSGNFNFAMIRAFGGHQDLTFGDTTLLGGASGIDNFSVIQSRNQHMTVHGDLALVARGSAGSPTVGGGVRIGGLGGGAPSTTRLMLDVDGDFTMTGGSLDGTGVALGNTTVFTGDSDIDVNVLGDIALNGGSVPGTFAVIGSRTGNLAGGNIAIQAGGSIALNSTAADMASILRTTDGVTLTAQQITQGQDARIEADSLSVETVHGASLGGANSVGELAMLNTTSGNVAFNNTSTLLTVTGIDQVSQGALNLSQAGSLLINGDVTSGAQSVSATGDMTITPGGGPNVTVRARGPQTFSAGGSFSLLGGTAWNGYAQTLAQGPVSISTGADLNVRGGSGLLAYVLLYGSDDIRLTVGDALRIDDGSGLLAFARVQTDLWNQIFLNFPNRTSGGYFVNGREGVTNQGLDGFFTGLRPARLGRSLIVSYGE